jgi:hypothetical protein
MLSWGKQEDAYWDEQFVRTGNLVRAFIRDTLGQRIDPSVLSMWLIEEACNLERIMQGDDDKARTEISRGIELYFARGPFEIPGCEPCEPPTAA